MSCSLQIRLVGSETNGLCLAQSSVVKCRDEQDIRRALIVDQDPLHIEISDGSRDDQGVMGEM